MNKFYTICAFLKKEENRDLLISIIYLISCIFCFIIFLIYYTKYIRFGLDITDESYHLYLLKNPELGYPMLSYGIITIKLQNLLAVPNLNLRYISIIMYFFSSLTLTLVVIKYIILNSLAFKLIILSNCLLSFLTINGIQGRFISYNSLIFCFACLSSALLLLHLNCKSKIHKSVLIFFTGVILSVSLITKFPFGILSLLLVAVYLILKNDFTDIVYLLMSIFITFFLVFETLDLVAIFQDFRIAIDLASSSHLSNPKRVIYLSFFSIFLLQILPTFKNFYLPYSIYFIAKIDTKIIRNKIIVFFLAIFFILISWHKGLLDSGENASFFMNLSWFYIIVSISTIFFINIIRKKLGFQINEFLLIFIFFIVPFICSIGTNAPIVTQLPIYITFWVIGIFFILQKITDFYNLLAISIILSIVTFSIAFNSIFTNQRRVYEKLSDCNNLHESPVLGNIYLDDRTSRIIRTINIYKEDMYKKIGKAPFLDINGMPGIYLFGPQENHRFNGQWLTTDNMRKVHLCLDYFRDIGVKKLIIHCFNKSLFENYGELSNTITINETNSHLSILNFE